jgi:hypothetical protein
LSILDFKKTLLNSGFIREGEHGVGLIAYMPPGWLQDRYGSREMSLLIDDSRLHRDWSRLIDLASDYGADDNMSDDEKVAQVIIRLVQDKIVLARPESDCLFYFDLGMLAFSGTELSFVR